MEKKNNTKSKKSTSKVSTKKSTNKVSTKKSTSSNKKVTNKKPSAKKTTAKKEVKQNIKKVEKKVTPIKEEVKVEEKQVEVVKEVEPVKTVKETKKNNLDSKSDFGGNEIRNLLIIIGAVCAVMLVFYFITKMVTKKTDKEDEKGTVKVEPQIQYEKILMGEVLSQKQKEYYVLVFDDEDPMVEVYNQYIESYKKTDDPLKVYKVSLNEDFNKSYIAEESYLEGNDITKIRVTGTTLIRVSEGSLYKSFEGSEAIIGRFNYMLGKN